jgi:hypothetical protein
MLALFQVETLEWWYFCEGVQVLIRFDIGFKGNALAGLW